MRKNNKGFRKVIWIIVLLILIMGVNIPVEAELFLTQEEKDYIDEKNVIRAASIIGGAPLHYLDSKGEIRGIAVKVLDEISNMTGLIFEYELYDSVEETFASNSDLYFGLTKHYTIPGISLSHSYLQSETNLFIRSTLDSTQLDNKKYASIKGGSLPEGVKEENTIYFDTREDTLWAVENGEADYGYGNEYAIAYYTLKNGFKNIMNIPRGKEIREYAVGVPEQNEILLSIINKSIDSISETQMQALILDVMSHVERRITYSMVMDVYGRAIFSVIFLIMAILLFAVISNIKAKNIHQLQNRRYEILSQISNEYLFEHRVRTNSIELSEKSIELFGEGENLSKAIKSLENTLLNREKNEGIPIMELMIANGNTRTFRVIYSSTYDEKGKIYSNIGKLIDISSEMAEKKELITRAQVDGLTGIYNAETTQKLITKRILNKGEEKIDALILFDCDKFKHINDNFGHLAGNNVLSNIGKAMKRTFRRTDILGRVGGDEFSIYMKAIPSYNFVHLKCEELIGLVKKMNEELNITLSIGVAFVTEERDFEELFEEADGALYEAKRKGGDQIIVRNEENNTSN